MSWSPSQIRYSDAARAAAVERYVAGEPSTDIARELGCSKQLVLDWVREAGAPVRSRGDANRLRVATARAEGRLSAPAPSARPSQSKYDQATRDAAVARYADGESADAIGRDLHCSGRTVREWTRASGVTVRSRSDANHWRAARARVAARGPSAEPAAPKRTGPPRGQATRRSDIQDDDEDGDDGVSRRRLMLTPEPSEGEVSIKPVRLEANEVRLVASAEVLHAHGHPPHVVQHSWDVEDVDHWSRGVLLLLSRAATSRAHFHREGRHVR